jgi:hypothetical protein
MTSVPVGLPSVFFKSLIAMEALSLGLNFMVA